MSGRKESKHLYDLIKSLSGSEKRYFKLYASNHVMASGNKYIELFDQLDQQQSPEAEYPDKKQKISKHLPRIRQYLYALILKSLDAYYAEHSIEIKLRKMLNSIEILFNKGLQEQCLKAVRRAKELAKKHEQHNYEFEIIRWEIAMNTHLSAKNLFKTINSLHEEQHTILGKNKLLLDYTANGKKILMLKRVVGNSTMVQKRKAIEKIVDTKLINQKYSGTDFRTSLAYLNTKALYESSVGNNEVCYASLKEIIDLYGKYPYQVENHKLQYISHYLFLLLQSKHLKKYRESFDIVKKLRDLCEAWPELEWRIKENMLLQLVDLYSETGDFEKGDELSHEIELFYKTMGAKTDRLHEVYAYFNLTNYFIIAGEYKKALVYCNKVLNYKIIPLRKDFDWYTRILNMVINYELKNYQLLEYQLQSFSVFLKKTSGKNRIEKSLLVFFHKLINISDPKEETKEFNLFYLNLVRLLEPPPEKKLLDYFHLPAWVESKLYKKSFAAVLKEMRVENELI